MEPQDELRNREDFSFQGKSPEAVASSEIISRGALLLALAFLLAALLFSGCDDLFNRSRNYIPADNTPNCTETFARDSRGGELGSILAHEVGQFKITAHMLEYQDEVYVYFRTHPEKVKRILAGEPGVIPRGCDNWGYDVEHVDLDDGYETDPVRIRLYPPDYWDEPENAAKLPPAVLEMVKEDIARDRQAATTLHK